MWPAQGVHCFLSSGIDSSFMTLTDKWYRWWMDESVWSSVLPNMLELPQDKLCKCIEAKHLHMFRLTVFHFYKEKIMLKLTAMSMSQGECRDLTLGQLNLPYTGFPHLLKLEIEGRFKDFPGQNSSNSRHSTFLWWATSPGIYIFPALLKVAFLLACHCLTWSSDFNHSCTHVTVSFWGQVVHETRTHRWQETHADSRT